MDPPFNASHSMLNGTSSSTHEEEGRFTNGPQIFSLEMGPDDDDDDDGNEEIDSLMRETGDTANTNGATLGKTRKNGWMNDALSRNNFNFRHRQNATQRRGGEPDDSSYAAAATAVRGFLRSHVGNASALRNFGVLAALAAGTLLLVRGLSGHLSSSAAAAGNVQARPSPHAPSLGGGLNSGHYEQSTNNGDWYDAFMAAAAAAKNDDALDPAAVPLLLPKSNVGDGVLSVTADNTLNLQGHYLHDPLKSPYASPYYAVWTADAAAGEAARGQVQAEFEAKLASYNATYGQWVSPLWSSAKRTPDFTYSAHKDLPGANFKDPSYWQSSKPYVQQFLKQAKQLVGRVKEGIYAEYGYGVLQETSTAKRDALTASRLMEFRVILDEPLAVRDGAAVAAPTLADIPGARALPGIAYLNAAAWDGLIRKLLHGMMTSDEFYVVLAGNANTYFSNNFQQSSIMEFNMIMEPVFDKLGMRLISRNMGMNANTGISALGGADIYGEADIFWYVPDARPGAPTESAESIDLLHKQAILSGERMPVILTPVNPGALLNATDNAAWFGNLQPGASFCEATTVQRNGKTMVPALKACRYVNCDPGADCDRHNSVCWVERSDQNPLPQQKQDKDVGRQKEGFPSFQAQRLEGRKLAMLVLHALDEALDRWVQQVEKNVLPLPDSMWHVGPVYEELREKVRTIKSVAGCDRLFRKLDPRICHMEMHAFTEWTPRVNPANKRLKSLVKSGITLADNHASMVEVYTGVDLLPPQWKPADDDVDVHMIAIAADTDALPKGSDADKVHIGGGESANGHWSGGDDDEWIYNPDDFSAKNDHDVGFDDDEGENRYSMRRRRLSQRRNAITSEISPKTWTVYNAPLGFCDGSAQSRCNRNVFNTCLLSNYNHYRAGIIGHAQSGKLSLSIPNVKEGIVLARFDWQLENGPRVKYLPPDFAFVMTVNGKTTSMSRMEFAAKAFDILGDLRLHVLLMDKEMSANANETKTIDIDLEVHSAATGSAPLILLSHIYYA